MPRIAAFLFAGTALLSAARPDRYALVLSDPPLAALEQGRKHSGNAAAADAALRIEAGQSILRERLTARGLRVTGSIRTLGNAIFVTAAEADLPYLQSLPGVRYVQRMQPARMLLNAALPVMNVPDAWTAVGGQSNAGAGVKIGILDSGIDQSHPAFNDSGLPVPPGFPKCSGAECSYTNSKVIAARSYVDLLVLGDDPSISRPDDLSPRDRAGHGTAMAMIAAGRTVSGPAGTITGVAPRAQLGNYKIFGSPGVNDITLDDAILTALEDAFTDGMDIANLSIGSPALWAPADRGAVCGVPSGEACDLRSVAVENAVRGGMLVVTSAGNDGDLGTSVPYSSIQTPGTAPSALTVGASYNSHIVYQSLRPEGLERRNALFGNGPKPPAGALSAPLRDVARVAGNGFVCEPLPAGSLTGTVALIERGQCNRDLKVIYAQRAGAIGAVIYQWEGDESLFRMRDLAATGIPAVLIGRADGLVLKSALATRPDLPVTLDTAILAVPTNDYDVVSLFSSQGPSIGNGAIKPEIVAVGSDLYTAAQSFDPNGEQYDRTGFTSVQGTSFASAFAAGAAALVKQKNPSWTALQIKSALVNSADPQVREIGSGGALVPAPVRAAGAGQLDAAQAVRATVTVEPSTLSFGFLRSGTPASVTLAFRNGGTAPANLRLAVTGSDASNVLLSTNTLLLGANQSQQVTVRLNRVPPAGAYEGFVTASADGGGTLRIPYLYVVGTGVVSNLLLLRGESFVTETGGPVRLTFKATDRNGAPVSGLAVRFRPQSGGGTIGTGTGTTDELGIAEAKAVAGSQTGPQSFAAEAGGLTVYFDGHVRPLPSIQAGGVVNAASGRIDQGLAPGSYISIYGGGLSDARQVAGTAALPLSLAGVSVSFDLPDRGLSLPGRLHFVSENQVNVQIPWELQGASSVRIKVSAGDISSALYTLTLSAYSPGVFEVPDPSGRQVAAALDERFQLIGTANSIPAGGVLQLYVNGLGAVDNTPATGEPSPQQPLARTRVQPSVTVGGKPAEVLFSGLAPGLVGLYQINLRLAPDTPSGIQPLIVSIGGVTAKSIDLPVR